MVVPASPRAGWTQERGALSAPLPTSPPCSLTAAAIAVTLAPPRYEFEGDKEDVLANMYQFNLAIQLYGCLLENATSEQASRMTAMDSATSNALDLVSKLTIVYNRRRQAKITTELTEIVAGAESV
jgi:ATP synthase F1 gamma subunit